MDGDSRGERDVTDMLFRRALGQQCVVVTPRRDDSLALQQFGQNIELRTLHAYHATNVSGQLIERRFSDQPSVIDDEDLVDGLSDLGEHVARNEHGAPARGEISKEV